MIIRVLLFTVSGIHLQGLNGKSDYKKGLYWAKKAASLGNPEALFLVGAVYADGRGVKRDLGESKLWFDKACKAGYENGCNASKKVSTM